MIHSYCSSALTDFILGFGQLEIFDGWSKLLFCLNGVLKSKYCLIICYVLYKEGISQHLGSFGPIV